MHTPTIPASLGGHHPAGDIKLPVHLRLGSGDKLPPMNKTYLVRADWDAEAKVWVATSDDVPGLATEADTLELLTQKLEIMVPELLEINGATLTQAVQFELLARRLSVAPLSAH